MKDQAAPKGARLLCRALRPTSEIIPVLAIGYRDPAFHFDALRLVALRGIGRNEETPAIEKVRDDEAEPVAGWRHECVVARYRVCERQTREGPMPAAGGSG